MILSTTNVRYSLILFLAFACTLLPLSAKAASCTAQAQMTIEQRDALSSAARTMIGEVQSGDVQALRANTIPAVAADFSGIADSIRTLKPLVQQAVITVDSLYALNASIDSLGAARTDFYCGKPVVALNFTDLPPGSYALAILHTTGVPQPQQISLILSETAQHRWMLAGFFSRPIMQAGHDGLWYWQSARNYALRSMNWNAWLYYRTAAYLLDPVEFLSSPNLEKLQHEEDRVHPETLPDIKPLLLDVQGAAFKVTAIGTTATFGALDIEVHYTPDAAQTAQLRDPSAARRQVTDLMTALLALRPELREAFHGLWVQAEGESATLYSLELPISLLVPGTELSATSSKLSTQAQATMPSAMRDATRPEVQARLDVDRDPILSLDPESDALLSTESPLAPGQPGEIQKRQDGIYTMHEDVDEVLLNCAVVDEKGRLVTDLSRANFRVWEDGAPQATRSFLHQDLPVSLGILIDSSGSMLDKRMAVDEAALNLLKASNPEDATFIVNFSDRAYLDQGFTSNISALNRGLTHFDAKGTTALYDAVAAAADELANHGKLPKQVLLVITDGADNASRLNLDQTIRRVQNLGGPVVYTIGLLFGTNKEEAERARIALERLSKETGGIAYFPRSLQSVDSIAAEVARDIRDQYTIGYHSTKPASQGGYRVVRVEASAPKHGGMIVRTRKGYYAKKPALQHAQTAEEVR
ncbi:MAG: VWA domain-containing protein [Terracidiphilus sp.]